MIKDLQLNWIEIEGEDGAKIDISLCEINPNAVIPYRENSHIIIALNDCELIELNKSDAIEIANKILELVEEE